MREQRGCDDGANHGQDRRKEKRGGERRESEEEGGEEEEDQGTSFIMSDGDLCCLMRVVM
jgi:hypothetical protein